ncbi:MAG: glycosyltransferase family 1 protein [Nitrospiraceae bacterium]|nr:MAG: glycosyltransferase family 1 protein [Nitrospiraceae bacterium]
MRIAVLRKKYTFHGGAEGFSSSFIDRLAGEGHEMHIFAIEWQADSSHENIVFHKVPAVTFNSFLRDLSFALSCMRLLKKQRETFDIIQTHDKTLYQDIYRAGDGCHIEWLKQRWKRSGIFGKLSAFINPYHWLILLLERSILDGHKFKKIIAISEMVKRNIIDHYKVSPSDIEVIYNGVDLAKFHPSNREKYRSEIRKKYGVKDTDFVVLFMGSGFERKGVRYLIQAVESLAEPVTVMIVGKGNARKIGSAEARKHGSKGRKSPLQNIIFCGPQKDNYKYYAAADVFVFPTMYEPFGNVHLEALASGLPVITTKNSGAAEIIKDGMQGFVIKEPEDIRAIAEKIGLLINNRELLSVMSNNARSLAEEFTFEKHIGRIKELYNKIISGCHSRESGNPERRLDSGSSPE